MDSLDDFGDFLSPSQIDPKSLLGFFSDFQEITCIRVLQDVP